MSAPPVDTSSESVRRFADRFAREGRHIETAHAISDNDHVEWCQWMLDNATILLALLQERDFLAPYVGAFRREETRADRLGGDVDDLAAERDTLRAQLSTARASALREAAEHIRPMGTDDLGRKHPSSVHHADAILALIGDPT